MWPMLMNKKEIPRQMSLEKGEQVDSGSQAALAASSSALGASFVINLCFIGGLNQIFSMIQNLQVIVHKQLVNLNTPANAQIFYSKILKLAAYDLFGELFDLDNKIPETLGIADSDPLTVNFDALGYETAYYAVNMGSALIIYIIMPFFITLMLFVRRVSYNRFPKLYKKSRRYVDEFFYNGIIMSVEEMYIIVLICIFVNFHKIM